MKGLVSTLVLLALLGPAPAGAQAPNGKPAEKTARVSGQVFGDVYWIPASHDSSFDDQNGFWFRRIYLTYDRDLSEQYAIRLRLESTSPSLNEPSDRMRPFMKDAYLKWAGEQHSLLLGLSPTPTWQVIETFWPRAVEKTPADLQKLGDPADIGVALKGTLGADKMWSYHVMIGAGTGTRSETDKDKKLYAALTFKPANGWTLQAYGDWENRQGDRDRFTLHGFAVLDGARCRAALQVLHQTRKQGPGAEDLGLDIASLFGSWKPADRLLVIGRVDRNFDPNPEGDRLPYLPFDPTAGSNLGIFGLDWSPIEAVHFIPNLEIVFYDRVRGVRPDVDVINRLTVYFTF